MGQITFIMYKGNQNSNLLQLVFLLWKVGGVLQKLGFIFEEAHEFISFYNYLPPSLSCSLLLFLSLMIILLQLLLLSLLLLIIIFITMPSPDAVGYLG